MGSIRFLIFEEILSLIMVNMSKQGRPQLKKEPLMLAKLILKLY
jgi:hypothetical protein